MDDANIAALKVSARLQAFEAAIPHADGRHQKMLYILLKLMEIREICRFFDENDAGEGQSDHNWKQGMINAILPHVNEERRAKLENLAQVAQMQEMLENLKEMSKWM